MNYLASSIGKYSLHTAATTYEKPNGEICAIFTQRYVEMINLKLTMIYCLIPGKRPRTYIMPLCPKPLCPWSQTASKKQFHLQQLCPLLGTKSWQDGLIKMMGLGSPGVNSLLCSCPPG